MVDVKIYFHYDKAHIDPTYMDNQQSLQLVDSLLSDSLYLSTLRRINIMAQSSPEGKVSYNERLSERRRLSIKEYFTTKYPQIDSTLWSFNAVAENWDLFHQHLQEDANLPDREQILSISSSDRNADDKEWILKKMNDGKPWRYIAENILPLHRFGASVLFIPLAPPAIAKPITIAPHRIIEPLEPLQYQYVPTKQQRAKLLFALKTNLALDVLSVINIAAEIPIAERWSVVGEVIYPWWRNWPANYTMQIESYHAEVKYWLGDRSTKEQLQGWSAGLYGGFGRYDIQPFSEEGVQGEFFDIGAQVCYSHPITKSRRFYMEYALGIGYISTNYNDYYMAYDTEEFGDIKVIPYPWMNSKLRSVLPTRLGVSLVWHIGTKAKGGSR
ncbi:MAG: DUF3575 domain-containing protein [Rikenellaceae bacterium]